MKTNKKILSLFLSLFLAVGALISPTFAMNVQAAEQLRVEVLYQYVNTKGNNSVYVDMQYVPGTMTLGEFLTSYKKCYENGTLKNVNEKDQWECTLGKQNYSLELQKFDYHHNNAVEIKMLGYPSNYKPIYMGFDYYIGKKLANCGRGWEILVPTKYAYGSKAAKNYISKNAGIYMLNKGLFSTVGAKITVEKVDGDTEEREYVVTVKVKAALDPLVSTLQKGKSCTLKLTGTKAKSWSTSNKSVATVNSKGKVTAKKAGTAIITCKGKDGKSYQCKVTVTR